VTFLPIKESEFVVDRGRIRHSNERSNVSANERALATDLENNKFPDALSKLRAI